VGARSENRSIANSCGEKGTNPRAAPVSDGQIESTRRMKATHTLALLAVLLATSQAEATNHSVRLDEIMASFNGDDTVQFIEMQLGFAGQNAWNGVAMLTFEDEDGVVTSSFIFPSNPPDNVSPLAVLIATQAFADLPSMPTPDFIIPTSIHTGSGKVCFKNNPANTAFSVTICLPYGNFTGNLESIGSAAPALDTSGMSLQRISNFNVAGGSNRNSHFALRTPAPTNSAGETATENNAPVANAQSVTTVEDTAVSITLTGSDADGDTLTFSVVSGPSNGALSGTAPNLTYTPNADFIGSDSFTFKVNDGGEDSASATVTVTVGCTVPSSGDWTVTEDCTLTQDATAPANVIVEANVALTIAQNIALNINFSNFHVKVKDTGKLVIKSGAKVDSPDQEIDSIAVLPFENRSGDPELEYVSDGIAERIISRLSQLSGLNKVISSASLGGYKGREVNPQTLTQEVDVRAVVIGSMAQLGENIRINVELIDGENNSTLWGETYTRPSSALYEIEEFLSKQIADALGIRLTGEEEAFLIKRYTESTEAYRAYLEGRYWWNKRSKEGFERAVELFNEAIEEDPLYALAYAGLADTYALLSTYYHRTPDDGFPKAKAAAQKALEIDDTLAEAHASLGFIQHVYEWDWIAAEAEFQRAIELNPNHATAHHWYGEFLTIQGRLDEGLEEMSKAQTLDPLSPQITRNVGFVFLIQGQYDVAIEQSQRALEMNPDLPAANGTLTQAYWEMGMYEEAIAQSERWASVDPRPASVLPAFYRSLASGNRAEAIAALRDLDQTPAWFKAIYYVLAGEEDRALEWLTQAIDERDPDAPWTNVVPTFDPLRDDPRFQDLLRRLNLQP
jgi:TolB-like protein/Tfp pilus assembly protein PilF